MESKDINQKQKLLAKAAHFGGAWKFIILYAVIFIFWVVFNMVCLTWLQVNPYLFILINLVLSGIVAIQAPIILISQNRDVMLRNEKDTLADMKSEMQLRSLEEKMDLMLEDQKKTISEGHEKQITMLKEMNLKLDALKHHGF